MQKLFLLLLVLVSLFAITPPVSTSNTVSVYYGGDKTSSVYTALALAPQGTFAFVTDPTQADVFLLNGVIPDPETIAAQVWRGAGLVLILGPGLSAADVETVSGVPVMLTEKTDAVSLTEIKIDDPLVKQIIWNSTPASPGTHGDAHSALLRAA